MRKRGALLLLAVACRPAPASVAPQPPAASPRPATAPAEIVAADPVTPPPADPAEPVTRFPLGQPAPPGLDAQGIREFARSQGDPLDGQFDLTAAFVGDAALGSGRGTLFAIIRTDKGAIECELFERSAPATVANFVGLARGVRPFRDPQSGAWITGRFYDGTIFHRVVESFMVQGGDRTGTGQGDIGYVIRDEIDPSLGFDAAGMLAMANRGSNTGASQFFITVNPSQHLTGNHAIFGKCDPKVPIAISGVPVDPRRGNRPKRDVVIQRIDVERRGGRGHGGARPLTGSPS